MGKNGNVLSIRVDNGIRRIEVNDAGEYIEVSLNNARFFDEFGELCSWLDEKQKELNEMPTPSNDAAGIAEITKIRSDILRELSWRLDKIFGDGACRKVFGDIIPDEVLVADFIEQITPIIAGFAEERNKKLNEKYSRNRGAANVIKF